MTQHLPLASRRHLWPCPAPSGDTPNGADQGASTLSTTTSPLRSDGSGRPSSRPGKKRTACLPCPHAGAQLPLAPDAWLPGAALCFPVASAFFHTDSLPRPLCLVALGLKYPFTVSSILSNNTYASFSSADLPPVFLSQHMFEVSLLHQCLSLSFPFSLPAPLLPSMEVPQPWEQQLVHAGA